MIIIISCIGYVAATINGGFTRKRFNTKKFNKLISPDLTMAQLINKLYYLEDDYIEALNAVWEDAPIIQYYSAMQHKLRYRPSSMGKSLRHTLHNGQAKLFLCELEFLTHMMDDKNMPAIVVYAGSAPSNKLPYLSKMFPQVKFICVDKLEHLFLYGQPTDRPTDQPNSQYEFSEQTLYFITAIENIRSKRHGYHPINYCSAEQNPAIIRLDKYKDEQQLISLNNKCVNLINNKKYDAIIDMILAPSNYRFFVFEEYFNNKYADLFSTLNRANMPIYFWSDIRTNVAGHTDEDFPGDFDLLWNSAVQYNWTQIIKPTSYMLKFKCPFFDESYARNIELALVEPYMSDFKLAKQGGLDLMGDYHRKMFRYLQSDYIFVQSFANVASTEARLVGHNTVLCEYDAQEWWDKFYCYNRVNRHFGWHKSTEPFFDDVGIDACGDCALALLICVQ